MRSQAIRSLDSGRVIPLGAARARTWKPLVLVPLFAAAAIAGAAVPWLVGYDPYGRLVSGRQVDRDDRSLCETFEFPSGTRQADQCKAALADLRRQYERQLLH
jgi:hypothetical protein